MSEPNKTWRDAIQTCRETLKKRGYWSSTPIKTTTEYGLVENYGALPTMTGINNAPPLWIVGTTLPIDFQALIDMCNKHTFTANMGTLHNAIRDQLESHLVTGTCLLSILKTLLVAQLPCLPSVIVDEVLESLLGPLELLLDMWLAVGRNIVDTYEYYWRVSEFNDRASEWNRFDHGHRRAIQTYCGLLFSKAQFPMFTSNSLSGKLIDLQTRECFRDMNLKEKEAALVYVIGNQYMAEFVCEAMAKVLKEPI